MVPDENFPAPGAGPTDLRCDSCGRGEDALEAVHRQYVTMDDSGAVTGTETVDEVEHWCLACRAAYPHAPA
ncbi:MAG: hypothetical protein ACRDY1_02630 [Acidimicrobiales bacterium]